MYNKVIIIGNLTRDPELKYTAQGTSVCNFSLAVNTKYSDKEEVLFIAIVSFGKQAESISKYLSKGSPCLVEGRLVERRWESNGEEKRKMEVIASNVRFLGKKKENDKTTQEPPEEHSELEPF